MLKNTTSQLSFLFKTVRANLIRNRIRKTTVKNLKKLDPNPVPKNRKEIRLFVIARNESLRLPFFLDYYFSLGVGRIFVIDNNSTDKTPNIVLSKQNTHLFFTQERYAKRAFWVDALLHQYGVGHWCLVVDADEVFKYPHCEQISLAQLCAFLDKERCDALPCCLLDMYPEQSLNSITYKSGTNPLLIAPWFDRGPYEIKTLRNSPYYDDQTEMKMCANVNEIYGGLRRRIFNVDALLSKHPLFKFKKTVFLSQGAHYIQSDNIADFRGALLHFKFLNDFPSVVLREVIRKEHWRDAFEYQEYSKILKQNPDINFHSSVSAKYSDTDQLIKLGIMKSCVGLDELVQSHADSACAVSFRQSGITETNIL